MGYMFLIHARVTRYGLYIPYTHNMRYSITFSYLATLPHNHNLACSSESFTRNTLCAPNKGHSCDVFGHVSFPNNFVYLIGFRLNPIDLIY